MLLARPSSTSLDVYKRQIWNRNKKDVTDEEYNNFYKEKFFDFEDPLAVIHANVEGAVTYKALLFIPAKAPYDFYTKDFKKGLQLYSSGAVSYTHLDVYKRQLRRILPCCL